MPEEGINYTFMEACDKVLDLIFICMKQDKISYIEAANRYFSGFLTTAMERPSEFLRIYNEIKSKDNEATD